MKKLRSIETVEKLASYTPRQLEMLKESAVALLIALKNSNDPIAKEFLNGSLGEIINKAIDETLLSPISNVPHFEKMTRDYLPEVETEYFNFYSLALYGKPAFE